MFCAIVIYNESYRVNFSVTYYRNQCKKYFSLTSNFLFSVKFSREVSKNLFVIFIVCHSFIVDYVEWCLFI